LPVDRQQALELQLQLLMLDPGLPNLRQIAPPFANRMATLLSTSRAEYLLISSEPRVRIANPG
jgi:hypothetical protein